MLFCKPNLYAYYMETFGIKELKIFKFAIHFIETMFLNFITANLTIITSATESVKLINYVYLTVLRDWYIYGYV
jgi:hypothetical protein